MGAIKLSVPSELRDRIPTAFLNSAEFRLPVNVFLVCLACLALSGFDNRNGWIYFVGAPVSPWLTAIYFAAFPFNPYRTPAARFSGMSDKDQADPMCKRLAVLMRSRSARVVLLMNALKLSLILLVLMWVISRLQAKPISWAFDAWIPLLTLFSALVLLPFFANVLVVWSLKNWNSRQA